MTELKRVLMERDGLTSEEADSQIEEMRTGMYECESFDELEDLFDGAGLELDYFDDLF